MAQSSSPLKGKGAGIPVNKRQGEFDVSTELVGYGLQGVNVTDDELRALVAELGLEGNEAGDLVKGLSGSGDKGETGEQEIKPDSNNMTKGKVQEQIKEGDIKASTD